VSESKYYQFCVLFETTILSICYIREIKKCKSLC